MTSSNRRNKVLVLGDSGVGKTSLVHLIAFGTPIANPRWTIGASPEVKLHEYAEGTAGHKSEFIELWDIGGSKHHAIARKIFYNDFHGIILVHDLTNRKSLDNLRQWLAEVFSSGSSKEQQGFCQWLASVFFGTPPSFEGTDFDPETLTRRRIPVLVVATKSDKRKRDLFQSPSTITRECNAEEIFVDCTNRRSLAPGSTNSVQISKFFDRVLSRRETYNVYSSDSIPSSVIVDRTRSRNSILSSLPNTSSSNRNASSYLYGKSIKYSRVD